MYSIARGWTGDVRLRLVARRSGRPDHLPQRCEHDPGARRPGQFTGSSTVDQGGATLLDEQTITRDQTTVASQYGWDARGVLDQITGNLAGDLTITPGGQVTALEAGTTLTYDQTGTLTQAMLAGATTTYTHDACGNRTTRTTPAPDTSTTDSAAQTSLLDGADPASVVPVADEVTEGDPRTSESSSNPTSTPGPEPTATEPAPGSIAEPDAEPIPGEPTVENTPTSAPAGEAQTDVFGWDAADRLATATVDGVDYTYSYFADGLRSTATTNEQQTAFVWATHAAVSRLLTDQTHRYLYGDSSTPIAQIDSGGTVRYLHGDLTGNIRTVTDQNGAPVAASDYSAYGIEHAAGDLAVSQITAFGYAGEYADPTGLIYLRARYYDPATAQFLSVDALIDLTQSAYGYVNGNPLQFVDPLGLWGWPWNWTGDEWDTVSTGLTAASWVLTVIPATAPLGAALGVAATATSFVGAAQHAADGEYTEAGLSFAGGLLGAGSLALKGVVTAERSAAAATGTLTRMTGSAGRAASDRMSLVGDAWTLLQMNGEVAFCGAAR